MEQNSMNIQPPGHTAPGGKLPLKMFLLGVVLLGVMILSFCLGRYHIDNQLILDYLKNLMQGGAAQPDGQTDAMLTVAKVRGARILAALLIGAGLSSAGAAYQGIFRNPMVSPDILGSATGASFGTALAVLLGLGAVATQVSSFCFGMIAVGVAYTVSVLLSGKGSSAAMTLVLTGMVISGLFTACISIIKYIGDPYDTLPTITYIQMGGLTYVTPYDLPFMLVPFAAGLIPLFLLRWKLNILSFDDEEAASLGVDTKRTRAVVILCATLVSSSAVAVGGMIGWVGLIVPHIARMIAGPDYSRMLPCAFFTGGIFLVLVDDVARCCFAQEIPLGVLTAVIGAPFFLYLMFRGRKSFI